VRRREQRATAAGYTESDFLADVSNFLAAQEQLPRPAAFANPEELEQLGKLKERFTRVPDKDSPAYLAAEISKKWVDMVAGALCCLVHDKNDLTRDDMLNAVVFVHGREEAPGVVQIGPRYFVCPGRLAGPSGTVGLLEEEDRSLRFSAFRLDGEVALAPQSLVLDKRNKLSVS
jgi:hypothetical protein